MLVEIIKDKNGKSIGWTMQGENRAELNKLCDIRNLQFFGFDENAIKYDGRKNGNDETNDPGVLKWVTKKHKEFN